LYGVDEGIQHFGVELRNFNIRSCLNLFIMWMSFVRNYLCITIVFCVVG